MLKFELVQTDKHSTNDLLLPKNLPFLSRTNLIKTRYQQAKMKIITTFILTLLFINYSLAQQENKILEEANLLYNSEKASWHGTDIFLEQFPSKKNQIGGYISMTTNKTRSCLFFDKNEEPNLLAKITFNKEFDLDKVEIDTLRKKLLKEYHAGNYLVVGGDWNQSPPDYKSGFSETENIITMNIERNFPEQGWTWAYDLNVTTNRDINLPYQKGKVKEVVIDYFLLSPNLQALEVQGIDLDFKYSDHQPVYIKFFRAL